MTEEERAIICAAVQFATADRIVDELQARHDDGDTAVTSAHLDTADDRRWRAIDTLLAAVHRYEEARRG